MNGVYPAGIGVTFEEMAVCFALGLICTIGILVVIVFAATAGR